MNKIFLSILIVYLPNSNYILINKFRIDWRNEAIVEIQNHLVKHPNCELQHLIPVLKEMNIYFAPNLKLPFKAKSLRDGQSMRVFINPNIKWIRDVAIVTLIHEATHLGNPAICGNDQFYTGNSVCSLFGKNQKRSIEITDVIREHLNL